MIPPRATYRLQFNRTFTFADAARIVPYLSALGISHVYASPWLEARAGSTHGYDVVDHNAFNPELGGEAGFRHLGDALRAHGIGHILDFVPNHMGVALADNAWWRDVLEWGRASPYAKYFDIRWIDDIPNLRNKVLLPFLGQPLERALQAGELKPHFDARLGAFQLHYFEHRFPLAPHTCAPLVRMAIRHAGNASEPEEFAGAFEGLRVRAHTSAPERRRLHERGEALKARLAAATPLHAAIARGLAAFAAVPITREVLGMLRHLLDHQHWRLAYWRRAADDINYRRFFDINGLAALRVEDHDVFMHMHQRVAQLLVQGELDGLRIDHIDGLYDPAQYLRRLRRLCASPFYLVVEKILARGESLPAQWPVAGTTGYDFLDQVIRLLANAQAEAPLQRAYQEFIGYDIDFDETLYHAKRQVIRELFRADLRSLARELHALAQRQAGLMHCTRDDCEQALQAVAAAFAVYRTYVDGRGASAADREWIARAVAEARKRRHKAPTDLFDFLEPVLAADATGPDTRQSARARHLAMRFQQFTAPVMAKGFEDTALYRHHCLLALNDVGGDPRQFAVTAGEFHRANLERSRDWPQAMLTTATHDTKRGEDARARLAALTEIPDEWTEAVQRWAHLNREHKRDLGGAPAPDRNDEYLLYQTLIGAWPEELTGDQWHAAVAASLIERVQAYMTKALREARRHTSWLHPDSAYERVTSEFVARILTPDKASPFLQAFLPFQARLAGLGVRKSLAQLALKLTCPGVADIYQGCESWDFSLVDPDNRRPVDFARRVALLAQVQAIDALDAERRIAQIRAWIEHWQDGAIKLFVLHKLLRLRAQYPRLFADGEYIPLEVEGAANATIAFERRCGDTRLFVIAELRDVSEAISHPLQAPSSHPFTDVLTGSAAAGNGSLRPCAGLPIAVWLCCAQDP